MAKKSKVKSKKSREFSKKDKENELEEDIENEDTEKRINDKQTKGPINENIEENKFQEFFQTEDFSPVLEKIFRDARPINLEQVAFSQSLSEKADSEKEENNSGYLTKIKTDDEPKYVNTGSSDYINIQMPSRFDLENERTDSCERKEIKFGFSSQNKESNNQEPKYQLERPDFQNTKKRNDPFERKEIKYKPLR